MVMKILDNKLIHPNPWEYDFVEYIELIDKYYLLPSGQKDWQGIWLAFGIYAAVIAVLFAILFKHKHDRNVMATSDIKH